MAVIPVGAGETYETWYAALASLGTLTEDTTLRQVADTAETSTVVSSIDLNGFNLTLESDTPHGGDPTVGWKSTSATPHVKAIGVELTGVGIFEVKDLHIAVNEDGGSQGIGVNLIGFDPTNVLIHDCIVTNLSNTTYGFGVRVNAVEMVSSRVVKLYNLAIALGTNPSDFSMGVAVSSLTGGEWLIENVTVLSAGTGLFLGGPVADTCVCRNCVGRGATGAFNGLTGVDGYNNASVDATAADANWSVGTDNVTGITLNDEFVSQVIGNTDFLKLKDDGVCHDGGSAPSIAGNTAGIRGTARPHGALYSIGADEYQSSPATVGGGSGGGLSSAILAAIAAGYR